MIACEQHVSSMDKNTKLRVAAHPMSLAASSSLFTALVAVPVPGRKRKSVGAASWSVISRAEDQAQLYSLTDSETDGCADSRLPT